MVREHTLYDLNLLKFALWSKYGILVNVPWPLEKMCILLWLGEVVCILIYQLDLAGCLIVQIVYIFTNFLVVLLVPEKGGLESPAITVGLTISSLIFCFIYFVTLLFGVYTVRMIVFPVDKILLSL